MHQRLKDRHVPDMTTRLDELRALRDGWLEGKGKALGGEGLDWLATALQRWVGAELNIPYLYPTAEGAIQAEWSLPSHEASLEIDLNRHLGYWHCLNTKTGQDAQRSVDLNADDDWRWIVREIEHMAGGAV